MEAKDTILTQREFEKAEMSAEWTNDYNPILDAQSQKSFKAGVKAVVKWGLETCPHDVFGEGTHHFKRACDLCWQEKWRSGS
jgi:hypothetical protein